jgi:protoporphyrinogen oxidase
MREETGTVIIGAGPAGCAAGLTLSDIGIPCTILDKLDVPGGLSRSIKTEKATFDIGPHRFFTQSDDVLNLWTDILGKDFVPVDRLTRILYRGQLFNYPVSPMNALVGLGARTSIRAFVSYVSRRFKLRFFPREPVSFEEWVIDNFGHVLYEAFFKHYTEKVWGITCSHISADWAAQRIKGLNLMRAVLNAVPMCKTSKIKTLVDTFAYPRTGSGLLYERMAQKVIDNGGQYIPRATVTGIERSERGWTVTYDLERDRQQSIGCEHVLSSMPITELIDMLSPAPPPDIRAAASKLKYRNHYCVNLLVNSDTNLFPDNWLYIHSPELSTGRIANFANFSEGLRSSHALFPITVEFFSSTGDRIDTLGDDKRIHLAISEMRQMGFLKSGHKVEDAFVVFSKAAYPVIRLGYEHFLARIRAYLKSLKGVETMGRGGLFQYNNQDHSIMTGMLAAKNVLGESYDVWSVNSEAQYNESRTAPDLCCQDTYAHPAI